MSILIALLAFKVKGIELVAFIGQNATKEARTGSRKIFDFMVEEKDEEGDEDEDED